MFGVEIGGTVHSGSEGGERGWSLGGTEEGSRDVL